MRVIIVGAGEVGTTIANNLSGDHDVVLVESDPEKVEELTYSLDVLPVHGDGTELDVLQEAGVENADMLLACTDLDEVNLVVCGTAKAIGDPFTVARVKRRSFVDTWRDSKEAYGVDYMVSTDLLTAEVIYRLSGLPGSYDVETFSDGLVRMAEFEVDPESPIVEETVAEADRFDSLTFAAIFRNGEVLIPDGNTVIQTDDRIVVIGSPESVQEFASQISQVRSNTGDVVILGGSALGYQTALFLEDHGYEPRLIERNHDRAHELAGLLPKTTVMESDATDVDFLEREHVDEADLLVACLDSDEKNLLACLLAKRIGANRTLAVVDTQEHSELFETVGVDVTVSPREEIAEEITRFTRTRRTEKVSMLEHDRAEVIEVEVDADSVLVGRTIAEARSDLPANVVVGAITRDGKLVVPRGDTVVEPGDNVILFYETSVLDEVMGSL